jgi:DhnA family fructose-bisphosphate aldolase class Ia
MKDKYYRIFRDDGKALILALDQGGLGNTWLDPSNVIKQVGIGGFDAILSTYGILSKFRKEIGRMGTMLRMEVFGSSLVKNDPLMTRAMSSPYTMDDCLRLGVDGVMTLGFLGNEFDSATVNYIAGVTASCTKYGLIAAAEMLPNGFSTNPEDRTVEAMNVACRVGAELGVDIVKTVAIKPIEDFKKVIANSFVDVLALGGAKSTDDRLVLENAKDAIDAGCKGLVIGRNVFNHKNIVGMAAALALLVHQNKSVEEALKALE